MKTPHYAWLVCAGCTLLMFCTMGLTTSSFNVYLPYIIESAQLTKTQGSTLLTVSTLFALLAMLLCDLFYRKTELRLGVTVAVLSGSLGFFLYGTLNSFQGFCVASAALGSSLGLAG